MAMRWGAVIAVIAVMGAVPSRSARADEAGDESRYRALTTEALAEYDAGRFEEARALFVRAHALSPSARTLRGIGMASFELRDYPAAVRALQAALIEKRRALTPDQTAHVQGLLERTRTFVGVFAVKLSPASASLTVDGKPAVIESDGSLLLGFGAHTMRAACASCREEERVLNVVGGEHQDLVFALDAVVPNVTAPAEARAPVTTAEPSADSTVWFIRAAVAGGVTAGMALWWINRQGQLGDCRDAGARCLNEDTVKGQRDLAAAATLVGATAAVGLAVVGVVVRGREAERHAWSCVPAPGGLGCALTF